MASPKPVPLPKPKNTTGGGGIIQTPKKGVTLPLPKATIKPVPMPTVNGKNSGGMQTLPMPSTPGFQNRAAGVPDRAYDPRRGVNPIVKGIGNVLDATSNVSRYVKNVGREIRDIPTALGTTAWSSFERENSRPGYNQKEVDNSTKAGWNAKAQVKDVFQAIGGQRGMRSDQYDNKGNYVKGSSLTYPKTPKPLP